MPKCCNLVYRKKLLLSEWAKLFGATFEIKNKSGLGEAYISSTQTSS